jgi:TPR repeat protein
LLHTAAVLLALAADGGVTLRTDAGTVALEAPPRETGCAEYQVPYQGKCMAKKRFVVLIGALEGWRDGCAHGDLKGCAPLGEAYRDGTLVPRAPQYAVKLFRRGCDAGEPMACRLLAEALQQGSGAAANPAQAATLLAKSCELGEPPACTALGRGFLFGTGVKADRKKARAVFEKGCTMGAQPSCALAAELDEGCVPLDGGMACPEIEGVLRPRP